MVKEFCVMAKNFDYFYLVSNNAIGPFKLESEMLFGNTILGATWRRDSRGERLLLRKTVKKMLSQTREDIERPRLAMGGEVNNGIQKTSLSCGDQLD